MKKIALVMLAALVCSAVLSHAGIFDNLLKGAGSTSSRGPDDGTVVSGLKEALSIGTENAVKSVSRTDGYFGNQVIKILMPEKFQKVAQVMKQIGYQKEVDDFVLSMNRSAEKAAPMAVSFFVDALKQMTFDDARKILNGSDTAATEFFKSKTSERIYTAFKPAVSSSMNEVGVTRSYKTMMDKYESVPFVDKQSLDLDHYVTNKALDGLFVMVGEEERKIRKDPAARVTDLLKTVFGK